MRLIYLDYNTTTPVSGGAREAMLPFLYEFFGAPNSAHWTGAAVAEAIEDARASVANMVKCDSNNLVFTSGGTESISLAFSLGLTKLSASHSPKPQILTTNWEYDAAHRAAAQAANCGLKSNMLLATGTFGWKINDILDAIGNQPTFLSLTLADGNTGLIQPIEELHQAMTDSGQRSHVLMHVDACQAVGKVTVNFDRLGADYLSMSGHKMYSAKGVGALAIGEPHEQSNPNIGDWFENGIRPGMPNVPGIIGMSAAAQMVEVSIERFHERCAHLYDRFSEIIGDCCEAVLPTIDRLPNRLPNTWLLALKHGNVDLLAQRCPELCIKTFVSSGETGTDIGSSASNSIRRSNPIQQTAKCELVPTENVDFSEVNTLNAIGVPRERFEQIIAMSIGWNTTESEIVQAAEAIRETQEQWK